MNHLRRHFQYFRKYTGNELTAYYDDGYIYIQGTKDHNKLKYIWVKAIFEDLATDNDSEDVDEDDIKIPYWLVPQIKEYILKNELPFMLGRPSDDSNNATLASVKPHGPQDD
nr:MAG TPA: Structural protein [Caudoviricetes sp.]